MCALYTWKSNRIDLCSVSCLCAHYINGSPTFINRIDFFNLSIFNLFSHSRKLTFTKFAKINVHEIYLRKIMIIRYYIDIRNPNLTKWATQLSIKIDFIRLQKPLCEISEVHAKQHVAWHARLKKLKHQMKSCTTPAPCQKKTPEISTTISTQVHVILLIIKLTCTKFWLNRSST